MALYLTPPGHAGATLACSKGQLCSHMLEHGRPLLLLPSETSRAQGKLKTYFKMLKRFLHFWQILDKVLKAGSSQTIIQQARANKQKLLPFQGHRWSCLTSQLRKNGHTALPRRFSALGSIERSMPSCSAGSTVYGYVQASSRLNAGSCLPSC